MVGDIGMKKWFHRSLKNQLIIFMHIAVIIPIFVLGSVTYISTVQVSKDRAEISGASSLKQLQTSLNFIIDDLLSMSIFLIGNRDVQDYLEFENNTPRQRSNINGFLFNLAYSKEYIANITINTLNTNPSISTEVILEEENVSYNRDDNKWWTYPAYDQTYDGSKERITMTRPIRSMNNFKIIGYLSISLNQEYLEEHLNSVDLEWNGFVLLLKDRDILASSNNYKINQSDIQQLQKNIHDHEAFFKHKINGQESTVFSVNLSSVDWNLIGIIPYQEYSSQNRYLLWLTVFTIIIASLFISFLVLFFVPKVLNPLSVLTKSLKKAKPGEKIDQVPLHSQNEIGNLIDSYNQLNERISSLMLRVKKGESLKRQVDLQALQNQINPHFLYNTLASIHWIALSSGSTDISRMVSSLSTYLRFSLNKGNEFCTIEQEIDHLLQYVQIQSIRFPDAFAVNLNIPNEIKQHNILKLLLQPLIENCILHGIGQEDDPKLNINVLVHKKSGVIYFSVKDDGVGISKEMIAKLTQQFIDDELKEVVVGQNYGLRNVNLRLILHYGISARLRIQSLDNSGTEVQFSIPITREEIVT